MTALITSRTALLCAAAIVGGFGRGANGAAGPFSPSEQAWLAEEVAPERRGLVYSFNAALGFFGMGMGALCATLPSAWTGWLSGALAYRPLFALVALSAGGNLLLLARAGERHRAAATISHAARPRAEAATRENSLLVKLVLVNAFNGLAIGLTGPLISYWFALRFRVGPAAIAPMMAATFALTGVASIATGKVAERIGVVRSVVRARLVGLVLMVLLPFMPVYSLASAAFLAHRDHEPFRWRGTDPEGARPDRGTVARGPSPWLLRFESAKEYQPEPKPAGCSALARQEPVAARGELARPHEQGLHLRVERLGLVAPAARGELSHAGEEVPRAQEVLVREEEVAAEARPGAGEEHAALEEPRERPPVRLQDGPQPCLVVAQASVVAHLVEVDDCGRPARSRRGPRRGEPPASGS
jgi:hypothetical protein